MVCPFYSHTMEFCYCHDCGGAFWKSLSILRWAPQVAPQVAVGAASWFCRHRKLTVEVQGHFGLPFYSHTMKFCYCHDCGGAFWKSLSILRWAPQVAVGAASWFCRHRKLTVEVQGDFGLPFYSHTMEFCYCHDCGGAFWKSLSILQWAPKLAPQVAVGAASWFCRHRKLTVEVQGHFGLPFYSHTMKFCYCHDCGGAFWKSLSILRWAPQVGTASCSGRRKLVLQAPQVDCGGARSLWFALLFTHNGILLLP